MLGQSTLIVLIVKPTDLINARTTRLMHDIIGQRTNSFSDVAKPNVPVLF